jgi:hypothetical protein
VRPAVIVGVVVLGLGVGAVVLGPTLASARRADACAEGLVVAQQAKDGAALERWVPSPGVRERITRAGRFELVYVRPQDQGSQVGYAVASSSTVARAEVLRLFLESEGEACRFLQDDEGGAFSRPGE